MPITRRIFVALALALATAACDRPEVTIDLRQNIHHDDFEYTVQRLEKRNRIGDRAASGVFYVVTFVVDNRAKRVFHEWDNALAYVTDDRGRRIDNDTAAQHRLADEDPFGLRERYSTPPGTRQVTKFVFDVPKDVTEPYLKVRGDTLMGDVLDGGRFARTRVKLF